MNTLHLKYVIEVDKAGSITKAADNLFMGQPNLSKAIRELEDSLGIVIFRRTSKGVTPTKKGRALIKHAHSILSQVNKLELLSENDSADRQRLCFYAPQSVYLSSAWLALIHKISKKQAIDLRYRECGPLKAINRVAEGQSTLSLIRYQIRYENHFLDYLAQKDIIFDPVWSFDERLIIPVRSPLASKDEVDISDLDEFLEIDSEHAQKPNLLYSLDINHENKPRSSRKIRTADVWLQLECLTAHADAFMLSPPVPAMWLEQYGLKQMRLKDKPNQYKDVLVYTKEHSFSDLEKQLIEEIYYAKNNLELNQ